ncbi:hypothetical protein [Aureimonas leprariae]|uniref:Uncharacterized protein n=1 Tax=Plantimonas leprariae TaxID=2615207 RepID=A0A7V7TYN5_9HYPH|nr:hypothetical protein [Aureimonas leprariae]KAB0682902.1 hypothetical protein F6X38_02135 [Aureimonas leprariae]
MTTEAKAETAYRPRAVRSAGRWEADHAALKLFTITATPEPMSAEAIALARETVVADGSANGLGFVILHRGEEALWLLLHWWLPGGILGQLLWSSPLAGPIRFEARDRPLMACVWELVPISFERDLYVRTIMHGRSAEDYLAASLPDGSY